MTNAATIFINYMNMIFLFLLIPTFCGIHCDILIYFFTYEEHVEHLRSLWCFKREVIYQTV